MTATNKHTEKSDRWRVILFFLLMFFFPLMGFVKYYIVMVVSGLLLFWPRLTVSWVAKLFILWFVFALLSINIRYAFYYGNDNFIYAKEYTEAFRILIPLVVFLGKNYFTRENFKILMNISVFYLAVDLYFTCSEFFIWPKNVLTDFVKFNYVEESMQEMFYLAKGLSNIGAEHGMIMNGLLIMYLCYLPHAKRKWIFVLACGACFLAILASGSRTHMLSSALSLVLFLVNSYFLNRKGSKRSAWFNIIFLAIPFIVIAAIQSGLFGKLEVLSSGLNDKAYTDRTEWWSFYLGIAGNYFYLAPIGWGKTIFVQPGMGFFTDNDYLTLLLTMGPIVLGLLVFAMLQSLIRYFFSWHAINYFEKVLFYLISATLLMSWASLGLSGVRWTILLAMFINFALVERERLAKENNQFINA